MPRKCKFTKEDIISAAIDIVREQGISAVTARSVGAKLNASTKVVFTYFSGMEELNSETLKRANEIYYEYIFSAMQKGDEPPYKASGLAYINFARNERELFKLLFMRDRRNEIIEEDRESIRPIIEVIQKNLNLSEDEAYNFHLELWIYVHGIATMIATSYVEWDDEFISKALTDAYLGLKMRYTKEGQS